MKSLKAFLVEQDEIPLVHRSDDGKHETYVTKSLGNKESRDMLNVLLLQATHGEWSNPYAVITRVAKALAMYGIQMPKAYLPDVTGGEMVFGITAHGQLHDYNQNQPATDADVAEYFLYFEYGLTDAGTYVCTAEVVDMDGLDAAMAEDIEEVKEPFLEAKTPESLDELKKSTLRNYVNKSAGEVNSLASRKRSDRTDAENKKLGKRDDGIVTAIKKIER